MASSVRMSSANVTNPIFLLVLLTLLVGDHMKLCNNL